MSVNEVVVKSPIASVMGARISITGPGRSMYLVIGRDMSLDSLVKTAGGEVILRFNGSRMLVILPFTGYLALRANYQISHIGPVTVDVKRLSQIAEMLAKGKDQKSGNAG